MLYRKSCVAVIAYVCCCHPNSTLDLHLLRASGRDRCKNMTGADERKARLNHWETREQAREALLILPVQFNSDYKKH